MFYINTLQHFLGMIEKKLKKGIDFSFETTILLFLLTRADTGPEGFEAVHRLEKFRRAGKSEKSLFSLLTTKSLQRINVLCLWGPSLRRAEVSRADL
jgi:hypothetical protein